MKAKRINASFEALLVVILMMASVSCTKEDDPPTPPPVTPTYPTTPYEYNIPDYFPIFKVPSYNPATVEGVELGKRLYYDPMLSLGGPMEGNSCSSCHTQSGSFSSATTGETQVLAHVNLNYTEYFLWNGKIQGNLETVCEFEITEFFKADLALFKADSTYKSMFYKAYGKTDFDEKDMAYALAQHFRSLNSYKSKFDLFWEGKVELTQIEEMGYLIFNTERGDCFHCHSFPLMTDHGFHNNGIDSVFEGQNVGRYAVTSDVNDYGLFKTPTLRNIELTAPYMHDGRFKTLDEVVEHYNSGVNHSSTLDGIMTKPGKEYGLQLTPMEKAAIVAFLKTLTDTSFTTNPAFSDPF